MNNLKSSEAYQYFHSSKVGRVLLKEVGHNFFYEEADIFLFFWWQKLHHRWQQQSLFCLSLTLFKPQI